MVTILLSAVGGVALTLLAAVAWYVARRIRAQLTYESEIFGSYAAYDSSDASAPRVGRATISQRGTKVHVAFHRSISRRGAFHDPPTLFSGDGFFRAGVLAVLFFDKEDSYRPGSIVLRYDATNAHMVGSATYSRATEGVRSFPLELRRERHSRSDL